jgi:hypothetical protein
MINLGNFRLWRLLALHLLLGAAVFAQSTAPQSEARYTISGQVQDGYGHLVAGAEVCAPPIDWLPNQGRGFRCERTNAQGQFVIKITEPGRYRVMAAKRDEGRMPQALLFFRDPTRPAPEVAVDEQTPSVSVLVPLSPKNGVLAVKVADAKTHLPVEDFQALMCRTDVANGCYGLSGKNAEGRMKFSVSHTPFTLRLTARGYQDWYGLNGDARMPIFIAPGQVMEAEIYLRRRDDSFNEPLNEAEKRAGVNLPAPLQLSPADGAIIDESRRNKTKLEWAAVEGAVAYSVEVDFCRWIAKGRTDCVDPQPHILKGMPQMTNLTETSVEFTFIGAQPGRWRVWAVDKDGNEGFKSPWRAFAYTR